MRAAARVEKPRDGEDRASGEDDKATAGGPRVGGGPITVEAAGLDSYTE